MDESMEGYDESYEAMDIDRSRTSIRDISDEDTQIADKLCFDRLSSKRTEVSSSKPVKRFHLNIHNSRKKYGVFNIFVILIAVSAAFIYILLTLECYELLDLHRINETLKANLYGQSVAIKSIVEALSSKTPIKLFLFYGGTGVGKTYTTSLIFNKFWQCSNIYHYTAPTFWDSYSSNLMFGLTFCKSSIIIIDDLTLHDTELEYHVQTVIEKSQNLNKNLTLILLYNSDVLKKGFVKQNDITFGTRLMEIYSSIEAQKYFISFKQLTSHTLRKCVERELNGKHVNEAIMKHILKNFNASTDGCKSVHSKLKYLNLS